ncbi:MAG: Gldg family protein [Planctomycetota bacterium]
MGSKRPVVRAIFKRDMKRWFGNPTGYVFISLFVLLSAAGLFWPEEFFLNNLANLDTLNFWFPRLLLFFIPAITMTVWAGEKGQGTDELLFTLPASDTQIVLGKYLAAAGIYTVALLFCFPIVYFLGALGDPDWGLLFSNTVGFWLLGLMLISVGMVGSQLSENLTIAFIFGAFFCSLILLVEPALSALFPDATRSWVGYGPVSLFEELGRGVISLSSFFLFVGLVVGFLYLNLLILSRRHWKPGSLEGGHLAVRFVSIVAIAVALTVIGTNRGFRADSTMERIHSLSQETRDLLAGLDAERPVYLRAYVSKEVPRDYVQTRRTLLNLLRQYDALGGAAIQTRIIETERFSEAAREAEQNFGIRHQTVLAEDAGRGRNFHLHLGIAMTCGTEEVVLPFLDKGLPVEYELTRSIGTVASAKRSKVGVLDTDAKLFGGFEFQTMRQDPQWEIVRELQLQYEVERVAADADYPEGLDALIVAMPSSLTQPQMDRLSTYIKNGNPTLLIDDPFPAANPTLIPTEPKGGPQNPFQQNKPPSDPKGNIEGFLADFDIRWSPQRVVWQHDNPHPQYDFPPELVFVTDRPGKFEPFNPREPISSGLQELICIFGGVIEEGNQVGADFFPLLRSAGQGSGVLAMDSLFQRNFFGGRGINPGRQHNPDGREKVMAARVQGKVASAVEGGGTHDIHVIFVADLDLVSSQFFQIRREGVGDFNFDNVTFMLNCVDYLAGADSFITLRKRRPRHRTLVAVEEKESTFTKQWLEQKLVAEDEAKTQLAEAQDVLDKRVAAIEGRTDLDQQAKQILIQSEREVQQRLFDDKKSTIEGDKERAIEFALGEKNAAVNVIRNQNKMLTLLSPLPGILFGIGTFMRRRRRERESAQGTRTLGGAPPKVSSDEGGA